ncbi:MAG: hypothetical protein CME06_11355 [Gemmatimonadetes bacterium]|nr:hypothetical protein [Gemmatimonadota bacterium]
MLLQAFIPGNVSDDRAIQAERFRSAVGELDALRAKTDDPNEEAAIALAIGALRTEIRKPKAPHEYLQHIPHLNELFPVFSTRESPRKD